MAQACRPVKLPSELRNYLPRYLSEIEEFLSNPWLEAISLTIAEWCLELHQPEVAFLRRRRHQRCLGSLLNEPPAVLEKDRIGIC